MPNSFLPPPLSYRKNIPLYYPKTEEEIKADNYEIYNPNVLRSTRNFYERDYGSILLGKITPYLSSEDQELVVELGCGSGFLAGSLSVAFPQSEFIGLDYSYQMLKMADQVFRNKDHSEVILTAFQNGMEDLVIKTENQTNLTYALSDACLTPLPDESVDICFSCFLWDRVANPAKLIEEKIRMINDGGKIIVISPFNYLSKKGWQDWHPLDKVIKFCESKGLNTLKHKQFNLEEVLDVRGNKVVWEVDMLVFEKLQH